LKQLTRKWRNYFVMPPTGRMWRNIAMKNEPQTTENCGAHTFDVFTETCRNCGTGKTEALEERMRFFDKYCDRLKRLEAYVFGENHDN
jgi:hypothetical protein